MKANFKNQRGDTIIEVILASTILSLITVSSFAIMQRASASAYDALERSTVRLQLNGQAELLNYFRDVHNKAVADGVTPTGQAAVWNTISGSALNNTTAPALNACSPPGGTTPFYLERNGTVEYRAVVGSVSTAAGLPSPGNGIWITRVDPGSAPARNYHDFYIMACWSSTVGGTQNMSSVVRLYDPS